MRDDKRLTLPIVYKKDKNSGNREQTPLFSALSDFYESHFTKLVGSLGYGIIINGGGNLSPNIEFNSSSSKNITISFEEGSFLDKEGRLIFVPTKISKSFNIDEYSQIYFYIKSSRVAESTSTEEGTFLIQEDIFEYEVIVSKEPKLSNSRYIELCRIIIDSDEIFHPANPFSPKVNEIDIRFVPRILSNSSLSQEVKEIIYQHLYEYGDFFAKLAPRIGSFNASIVASDAYQIASKIRFDTVSTFEIYGLLSKLVKLTALFNSEVRDRIENIKDSDFGRNFKRLDSIFSGEESITHEVKFYDIDLDEGGDRENFWENIFSHIEDIYQSQDSWNPIIEEISVVSKAKDYLLLGRKGTEGLDIEIDYEWVSGNHLRITKNDLDPTLLDIEDLGSSNGTYFKGIRYEEYQKVTVGRYEKIELYDYEFDIYNNPIVREFLEDNS